MGEAGRGRVCLVACYRNTDLGCFFVEDRFLCVGRFVVAVEFFGM